MAHNLKHVPECSANRPYDGRLPMTALRAETLASCTVSRSVAAGFVLSRPRLSRTISWCEYSYLMRRIPGGWRLTAAGEDALRLAFVAHCESWPECIVCGRRKPLSAFVGKRGRGTRTCATCINVKNLSGLL